MKNITLILVLSLLSISSLIHAEGFYKWKDARGNTQYGDTPPPNVEAENMTMPAITVIDNYAEQWKPVDLANDAPQEKTKQPSANYKKLDFIAPKADQSIRANDGDVSAMISLKPPLKAGHSIAFYLDGKEVSKGDSRTSNFTNLPRGEHTVAAKVIDENGRTVKNKAVTFTVLRFSKLFKKGK